MSAESESFPLTRELLSEGYVCIMGELVAGAAEVEALNREYAAALAELDEAAATIADGCT